MIDQVIKANQITNSKERA